MQLLNQHKCIIIYSDEEKLMTIHDFLAKILSQVDLIAFGETHHGQHSDVFKQMSQEMYKFTGLFLEEPVNYQNSINTFLKTGVFDKQLEKQIEGAAKEGKDIRQDFLLWKEATKNGELPVICIDSSKERVGDYQHESNIGHYFLKGRSREEDMYENVIDELRKRGGKWCLVGGSQHIKYGIHYRSGDITLGKRLKDALGNQFYNVCLWNLTKDTDKEILQNRIGCFDVKNNSLDPALAELMKRNNSNIRDENGDLYFDAYIVHV